MELPEQVRILLNLIYQADEEGLSPEGMVLSAEMSGGVHNIVEYLGFFCEKIEEHHLKPWGRKGRLYLYGAVEALVAHGAHDSLITCDRCYEKFLMRIDKASLDLYLKSWKDDVLYDFPLCRACGGSIEREDSSEK